MESEQLYRTLGNLVSTVPAFANSPLSRDEEVWLARAYAAVRAGGDAVDTHNFRSLIDGMRHTASVTLPYLMSTLYRTMAVAELYAPPSVQGMFVAAGSPMDAMTALGKVLKQAKLSARIVDPYMDEVALTDFTGMAGPTVKLELLADEFYAKQTLKPAVLRWQTQHTTQRPLEARLTRPRALHDRLIIIDRAIVFTLTQSLAHFAARSPATIIKIEGDTVPLKIAAYEELWESAAPIT